jgi:prepilin-type N-terminal cleavage/methylation domain-containing protein
MSFLCLKDCPIRARSAFTLIELLVVIGLIAVLAGGIGLSLGQGNSGIALQNAQSTLSSALSGARAQAALNQASAGLFVNSDPSAYGFLQELRIAALVDHDNNSATPAVWVVKGDAVMLSKGIYLVPPVAAGFAVTQVDFQPTAADWASARSTSYDTANTILYLSNGITPLGGTYRRLVILNERGTTGNNGSLILAPADVLPGGTGISFKNAEFLRGARVSRYGVATAVAGQEAFN